MEKCHIQLVLVKVTRRQSMGHNCLNILLFKMQILASRQELVALVRHAKLGR
jgi:hypothetical protein